MKIKVIGNIITDMLKNFKFDQRVSYLKNTEVKNVQKQK